MVDLLKKLSCVNNDIASSYLWLTFLDRGLEFYNSCELSCEVITLFGDFETLLKLEELATDPSSKLF
jgi:hypothetical protein